MMMDRAVYSEYSTFHSVPFHSIRLLLKSLESNEYDYRSGR